MSPRLANGYFSQKPRAIKWRAKKAVENAAYQLANGKNAETFTQGEPKLMNEPKPKRKRTKKPAPDAIGVFSDDEPAAPEPDRQDYFCENCRGTVHQGDERCLVCNERLNWAGVERD